MTQMIHDVAQFMAACGHRADDTTSALYFDLVKEELSELAEALVTHRLDDEADAIADTIWVLIGYGLARGFPLPCIWNEVARSNLAKIDPLSGTVLKRPDGKVLKPAGWQPPNIQGCLGG